jgi:hypothetical protein
MYNSPAAPDLAVEPVTFEVRVHPDRPVQAIGVTGDEAHSGPRSSSQRAVSELSLQWMTYDSMTPPEPAPVGRIGELGQRLVRYHGASDAEGSPSDTGWYDGYVVGRYPGRRVAETERPLGGQASEVRQQLGYRLRRPVYSHWRSQYVPDSLPRSTMRRTTSFIGALALTAFLIAPGCGDEGEEDSPPASPKKCTVVPSCPAGTQKVSACPDGGSCIRNETCGGTAICLEIADAGLEDTGTNDTGSADPDGSS